MRTNYSAIALTLFTAFATAQDCPTGYKKATVSWYSCPVDKIPKLQCATLQVPLDYSQPTGEALDLRLIRVPASTPNAQTKSIIYNPGGPGEVGIGNLIGGGFGLDIQKIVGTEFNLIGFDPRGTGLSRPFQCKQLSKALEYKDTKGDFEKLYETLTAQANECANAQYKADSELMGTAYVARDIKAISEAIEEDNLIRYLGYSYGTLLGATTAAMFPKSIDRMVLDGNINFQDYYYGQGYEAVSNADKAVARFFDLCSEAGEDHCAVANGNQTGAQLMKRFDRFLSNLTYADSYSIRDDFFSALYNPADFDGQADKLADYYEKSGPELRRSLQRRDDGEDGVDNTWKPTQSSGVKTDMALAAVTCGDWVANPVASVETFKEWRDTWLSTSKYVGDLSLLSTLYQCSLWKTDAKEKYEGPFTGINTLNPILFVNTPYDPVTPLDSAEKSSASFANSRLVVSTGGGHCSTRQPSKDLDAAIHKYFQDASVPPKGQTYNPEEPNPFKDYTNTTKPATKSKRKAEYAHIFKDESVVVRRQTMVPVGCVPSNSTLPGSNSTMPGSNSTSGTGQGNGQNGNNSGGSSQSAGSGGSSSATLSYSDYSGSTRSAGYGDSSVSTRSAGYGDYSGSTRSAGYGDYQDNNYGSSRPTQSAGYDSYGGYGSNPSSKRPSTMTSAPTSVPTVPCTTSTITDFTYETITKCSNNYNCQMGSIVTKTNVRTTVITLTASVPVTTKTVTDFKYETVTKCSNDYNCQLGSVVTKTDVRTTVITLTPSSPVVSGTPMSRVSGTPGQGYNVPPKSVNVDGSKPSGSPQSAPSNPGYGSPAKPSTVVVVNDAAKSTPTAVASPGTYGTPNRPVSVGGGSNGTAAVGTPTGYFPAQFTGGAASQYGMQMLLPAIVAFLAACVVL